MARQRTYYVCEACGAQAPRWSGQCADCGAWNTLTETRPVAVRPGAKATPKAGYAGDVSTARLDEVRAEGEKARTATGLDEFDRVLGGGLVAGSVSLIGGDPGIGKSTLLLQVMAALAEQQTVLYV